MSPELLWAVAAVFVGVGVVCGSATSWLFERNAPERKRLRSLLVSTADRGDRSLLVIDPVLGRLSKLLPKSPKDLSRLQRRLTRAGYPLARHAAYFTLAQFALPLVFGVAALAIAGTSHVLPVLPAAAVGYLIPGLWVRRTTTLRQKAMQNGLPDALDLLTVCVEAGSGLDQAIVKASDELAIAHPALADELKIVTTEIRAGKPRLEAFTNFSTRTGVDDVRTLVAMLIQTDRFGTSVAQALRTHAATSRTKRRQRAEERAGKVSVKLVFPLALCLFPALYVVCFGPVVVKIYRAFFTGAL